MTSALLNADDFCVFTFISTSHALKAEKVLKEKQLEFIIMPTLREISSSCGLSIKIFPDNLETYREILVEQKVTVEGVYRIKKVKGKNQVVKLND